jgi:simple sugar transport system substrate-binding protein
MAKEDIVHDAVERLEFDERKQDDTPKLRLRQISRRAALTGGAAGIAALALEACGSSSSSSSSTSSASAAGTSGSAAAGVFGTGASYKFVMVNHVTTNVFFTPTQNGMADAAKLLGIPGPQWTGSESSNVGQMVTAMKTAINAKADGIGVALIAKTSFNAAIKQALGEDIPVVAYNADEPESGRLSYVGQDLFQAGVQLGQHAQALLPNGGQVGLFIATPGAANIQPRIDGAKSVLGKDSKFQIDVVTSGASVPGELTAVQQWQTGHTSAAGMFAVDGGTTQGIAQVLRKQNLRPKVKGGGFDLTPITEKLLSVGDLDFTIDQQPYLQGFLPILQMYMYKVSGGLVAPVETDTGLKFVTKDTVGPYVSTKSRYEGTSTSAGVTKA